ncbi:hypothetical protein KIN20_000125 [Parelaphostrongylus tenuis]|uniref:Uncharacterized protein n=1 Tax=Parelaphostrongylus tenuis TaxID=148309 RepID=A0AAD5MAQ4_PARTN|nr:hypothetical protein KIN20_000125 [Parelaphostrongylus tenuis]
MASNQLALQQLHLNSYSNPHLRALLMPRFFLHHLSNVDSSLQTVEETESSNKRKTTVPKATSDTNTDLIVTSTLVTSPSKYEFGRDAQTAFGIISRAKALRLVSSRRAFRTAVIGPRHVDVAVLSSRLETT